MKLLAPSSWLQAAAIAACLAAAATQAQESARPGPTDKPVAAEASSGGLLDLWDPTKSPFIPIPEIGTDPNSGTTYGILPVFLTTENGVVSRILAPDVTFNSDLGYGGNFRLF